MPATDDPVFPLRLDGSTALLGILGDPIAQVKAPLPLSRLLQQRGYNALLVPMHVGADDLPALLASAMALRNLAGLVVTVPHKQQAARLCATLSPAAAQAGAANVLRKVAGPAGPVWQGDLLDGSGFVAGLARHGCLVAGQAAALAGAGGAGSAIAFALAQAGAERVAVHDLDAARRDDLIARLRAEGHAAEVWDGRRPAPLLVNATPMGMRPGDPLPFAPEAVAPGATVGDVVTEPAETALLALARQRGARTVAGRHMMESQLDGMVDFFGQALRALPGAAPAAEGAR